MSDGTRYDDAVMQGAFESGREVGEQAGFERGVRVKRARVREYVEHEMNVNRHGASHVLEGLLGGLEATE